MTRSALVAILLLLVGALAAGCGTDSLHSGMGHDSDMPSAEQMGTGRAADVMFTQQMLPHHQQAVDMADLALDPAREASPAVKELATRIKTAQTAEIADMRSWLSTWGAEATNDHADHGGMGMLSSADLAALEDAKGAAFDRLWLEGMIAHHEGALMMASHIGDRGDDPEVQRLADAIDQSQTAEIAEMRALLGQ